MAQKIETRAAATRSPRVNRSWWVIGAAALAIIGASASTTMSGVLVDPLHMEFNWTHGTIDFAVSLNMVLYGVTAPFAAASMDRFGIRKVVALGLTTIAAGTALTTVMATAWQFVLFCGLLVGLGTGSMAMVFAATVASRWFVKRRGLVAGTLTAASVFGQFIFLPFCRGSLNGIIGGQPWRP
jgi:MFS family permease